MSLDLAFDDAQLAIADTLAQFCEAEWPLDRLRESGGALEPEAWSALAEFGVLGLGSDAGVGGALELCAALEALGFAVFPGPLVATVLAARLLEGDERSAVVDGRALATAGQGGLFAFADRAEFFFERCGRSVRRGHARGAVERVDVLGGEPWGRVDLELAAPLAGSDVACSHADVAYAAYTAAAIARLIGLASAHARTRRQFGRALGEFQAVAHPLADLHMTQCAARALARAAAADLDAGEFDRARTLSSAAWLSTRDLARASAHVCHQVFGAIGITTEGPAFVVSRRIAQLAAAPGGDERGEDVLRAFEVGMEAA